MTPTYERVLIVGASDGLSAAVARALHGAGLRIGLAARQQEPARPRPIRRRMRRASNPEHGGATIAMSAAPLRSRRAGQSGLMDEGWHPGWMETFTRSPPVRQWRALDVASE